MGSMSKEQKAKVSSFVRVTNSNAKEAVTYLNSCYWDLEHAVNMYLSGRGGSMGRGRNKALHDLYLEYEDKTAKKVLAEGIIRFCEDIGIAPEDVVMIVICWHMDAQTMGEFTEEEFEGGLEDIGVDSITSLKAAIPSLRKELNDRKKFKEIYEYAFMFSRENNQKCLQLDVALSVWPLLITKEKWKYIDLWCEFLQEHHKKAISKDTWTQLLDFIDVMDDTFSQYDPTGAWPYLIDEFVALVKEQGKIGN
ncbi:hypothetical protein M9434_000927 [Picochlorum sp. BPE23]|nr:hypothetical protein M9434_000927 [Picochlorum sp. BPE23]KAI8111665.1 hypothetical protein M9435_004164 [Picochlorum sp. BPE23]WPT12764.1 DCN1-like protein 1 [Picochlorum sp. SENEW3]|mmetsp:Transcript_11359/g.22658  ORF Transcript_11359/g.22658 Transcript_11359/m.22658 type:complete len:251 (+) Transcript_11359:253-1005(+)|eukprot:jgi/Picre1/34045/NNA_001522.t1